MHHLYTIYAVGWNDGIIWIVNKEGQMGWNQTREEDIQTSDRERRWRRNLKRWGDKISNGEQRSLPVIVDI